MQLDALGFDEFFRAAFDSLIETNLMPARVCAASREHYRVLTAAGSCEARLRGRLRRSLRPDDRPVVGDWVALQLLDGGAQGSIAHVLPRRGALQRRRPGASEPQLMAANLDYVLIVSALNRDLEPRRIERALAQVWEAGAQPVILLTKRDLCPDWSEQARALSLVAGEVHVHALCAHDDSVETALQSYLAPGKTLALIGSSGVGKTTLTNRLLGGAALDTQPARAGDDKGRHTTTQRELFVLPNGALLIDTPGMRELGLWEASDGLDRTFADVAGLIERCRFSDCRHQHEPGCAVQAALVSGALNLARYESFEKLEQELAHQVQKSEPRARIERRHKQRAVQRQYTRQQRERSRD
jgi:ribosome biogenesis GTPase